MAAYHRIPNIRHLRMIQMIGRLNGVSSAARYLNASQPAVTQAVGNIEEQLGAPIFDRRATGTYATEIGKVFMLRIDRFFDILEAAVYEILGEDMAQAGRRLPMIERFVTTTQLCALMATSEPATIEVSAASMGVSSASLFRSVRSLERSLGKSLFERSASGTLCNATGEAFARQVRRASREIEFAMAEVAQLLGHEELEIVVGMLPMAGTYELAGAIRSFTRTHPTARVAIRTGTYHALLDDLLNCRIDMIFGLLRKPDWEPEIEEELMFRDSYCLVCRPGHPLTRLAEITPARLLDYDWIVPAIGTPRRTSIERIFAHTGSEPRGNIEVNSLNCARALLLESDMLTVMARSEVRLDAKLGTLIYLPCAQLNTTMPKGVATRKGWLPTDCHSRFLTCLREETADTEYGSARFEELAEAI